MKNYFTAFALAAVLAIAGTAVTTQPAEAHSSTGGKVAAGLGGLGLGLALGAASRGGTTYVYPAPVYAAPPAYYYPPTAYYAAPAYYPAYPAPYYAPVPVYIR